MSLLSPPAPTGHPQHGGTTGLVAAVEAPLPYPGGLENGLVVDLARDHLLMDLAPLQELGLHVSFGVDLPCVDQGCGRLLVVSISQALGVIDVGGCLPDPPLSLSSMGSQRPA